MAGAGEIFGRTAEFHQQRGLGDQLADMRADHVHAQHPIGRGIGQDLDEAVGRARDLGAPIGHEIELADGVGDAGFLQFFLATADGGDFGRRVDDPGNDTVIHVPGLARE